MKKYFYQHFGDNSDISYADFGRKSPEKKRIAKRMSENRFNKLVSFIFQPEYKFLSPYKYKII